MQAVGLDIAHQGDVEHGSWFRSWRLRESHAGALKRLARLAEKVERAGELKYIYGTRAVSDEHEANAVATVIRSLEAVESAVIQLSSMIIIKVDGQVMCRMLSETELRILRDHPELVRSPRDLFDALSQMVDDNRRNTLDRPYPRGIASRKGPDDDNGLDLFDDVPPAYPPVYGS